jgi:predicted TIM-barrel fold metal-dependent hydrolase
MYTMKTSPTTPRVDTHFHIFEAGKAIEGARYVPAYAATLNQWWSLAGAVGVTHGVLVQPSFLGTDNRLMLEGLVTYPGRLMGVAVVEPTISLEEMTEMHSLGVRGVRLNLVGGDHRVEQWSRNASLWDRMISLGWHVEIHTDPGRLSDVLPKIPSGPKIVVDHMAKPLSAHSNDPTLQLLRRYGPDRVIVKLSGAYRQAGVDAKELAEVLLGELGASALLWGSDWPCTNHENCADYSLLRESLDRWVGEASVDEVMSRNPMRLYWGIQDIDADSAARK